ncbi:unnamed protein product [Phaedon cochleariae]|uniref:RecQ-mediated genome instability protein 1 n=1 Tax=Phaedon cochleariae TaxID=80249 RepID=A0A9N9SG92_PHACE|nr:unnamed protein product [Phaedon cochleariae]
MNEITVLEDFFKSKQVLLARPWLVSCINWCKEENLSSNYTIKDLQFSVFEQWLLLDLRDVEIPCLPPDLSSKIKHTLNGIYSLQVMQIVDISKPKLWQLQRIRNGIPKNLEQEVESSKRALLITLSDGVQEIEAMEFKPIKCLNLNLSPGIKVRLMGPMELRRGRIMLQEQNIKILGGEVDSLIVPNAAENILAKHFNLPLNPKPAIIQESIFTADTTVLNQTDDAPRSHSRTLNEISSHNIVNQVLPFNQTNRIVNAGYTESGNVPKQYTQIAEELDDLENENSRINDEIEMMMEVEREFEEVRSKRKKPNVDVFDNMNIDDAALEDMNIPEIEEDPSPTVSSDTPSDTPQLYEYKYEENDFFSNIDLDAHLDKIDMASVSKPITSSQMKIWTIEKLSKNIPNISNGKFKIRAKYKSVVEKMCVVDDAFHLVIKVTDDTGDIDVRLHTDVVGELFGRSAPDVMKLKSQVIQRNPEAQQKMLEGLRSLKDRLTTLDRIAEVQVTGAKFPLVLRLL